MSKLISKQGTTSSVAVSTTSATIIEATTVERVYAIIHNESGGNLYLRFSDASNDATTSAGGYSVIVADGSAYEIPSVYRGDVTGILDAGSGDVSVTVFK